MGLGDLTNSLLGGAEDLYDSGKKKLGEGVDWATNEVGEGLDKVGAHGWADGVEDWGDEVASDLGATPGEQQLGQSEEANELVHGSPDKIRASAKHLKDFHGAFAKVSSGLKKVDSTGWQGEGGDAFRKKFGVHPAKWGQASQACDTAAGALESYADTVKWAQGQAEEAVELYTKGVKASKDATDAYNAKVDAYNAKVKANEDPGPKPEPFQDPGKADVKAAVEKLAEARKQRNTAASEAQGKVRAALAHAPAQPPPLQRLGSDLTDGYQAANTELTHVAGGALKGTAGLLNFARGLNPTDPYNLTHPAAYVQNVNTTLAGLVSTAAHPERIVQTAVDGFKKDPSEFVGRLIPELVGTKGAGLARSGLRLALKEGAEDVVAQGLRKTARTTAEEGGENAAAKSARERVNEEPAQDSRSEGRHSEDTDPIDLATGKMYLPQTDVVLPGVLPLSVKRRAESGYHLGRWFGPSWSSTIDQRLEIDAEGVVFVTEDGLLLAYPHPAPGVPTLPSHGPGWPLDRVDGGYTITDVQTLRTWHFADRGDNLAVLEQIDDRNGNWLTFEYDPSGIPLAVVSSSGQAITITTESGRITALHLAATGEELKRYGYTDGHLTEVINSSGMPLRFTYDDAGRITSWTDTNHRSYTYAYDDRDRCTAEGGSAGHLALRLSYQERDPHTGLRTTTATTGQGHTRRYLINDAWQVVAAIDALGATTRYRRDRYNRLLTQTDPLGHTTTFHYDASGNLTSVMRPDGRQATAQYNALGQPVKVINLDGAVVHQTYDARGNRTSVTDSSGQTTRFSYSEAGHLTAVTDPLGDTTTLTCDRAGLLLTVTNPKGARTRYERDAFGRPTAVTDPTGATTRLHWTLEGHLARRTAPDGSAESWTYDGEGNCTSHTDPAGGVTRFEYTHFDLLTARTGPDGARYEFTHDSELRLAKVTHPHGLTWNYAYDAAGRLVTETDFDGRTLTYAYDDANRLTTRTNALGETVSFTRNELGQVIRKDAAGQITTYAYDLTDELAHATGPDATTVTLLRDRHGRLHSETVNGRTCTYTYDTLGRRTSRTTPTGATTTWSYDAAGHCTHMSASGRTINFTYDEAGREQTRHIGQNIALDHTFDSQGRLTTQSVTGTRGRTMHRAYSYRADGNLVAIDDDVSGSRRFDLDAAGRVTAVHAAHWTETYAYDEAGNQTHAQWPSSHPGHEAVGTRTYTGTRITRAGNVRYEHDALGRITLRQKTRLSRKPDTWHYAWDAEDHLTSVVTPDGTRWRYTYDPLGRRTAKLRLAGDGETVVERVDFTWDGTTLCEQTTASPDLPHPVTLTWDHQGIRPLAQTERITASESPQHEIDSRFFAIVTDLIGTPSELIDEQGDIAWRTRSTLWGRTAWADNSSAYTPLRFPGQYYDPETGLHYNYFRHYDPETARFLTPDPLGLSPAPNPDTYVDNPHTWGDPLGLAPDECPYRVEQVPDDELGTLYHYTNEGGYNGILESKELRASLKADNPKDARFGDGQYLSDIQPGTKTPGQLSYAFVRVPWAGHKFSHFIEVDVRGLQVMRSVERPDVFVVHNQGPLDLTGRIVSHGKS
ncbi:putative T7SS-secreted protein [Streptomyces mangrovisoli]|uniref:putative T7SS-secreted protein n=1 Tax=Streptomyces mangrovisoli TaxID=1428628 RepID=UPI0009A101E0|nr:HYD1 signature containing ADP-ribosyltransferase family protein [Streptomyces mangrovisoli]